MAFATAAGYGENFLVDLDYATILDLSEMNKNDPVMMNAELSVTARVLHHPITFEIPRLGVKATPEMEDISRRYFKPWLLKARMYRNIVGVIPYYSVSVGPYMVPETPELSQGRIRRCVHRERNKRSVAEFRWYWLNERGTLDQEHDPRVHFHVTHYHPRENGEIVTPLVSLLPMYTALKKLLRAQNRVVVQRSHPLHLLESRVETGASAVNDHLNNAHASFGAKAAGLTRIRRNAALANDERNRQEEMRRAMARQQAGQQFRPASARPVLRTEDMDDMEEEHELDFASRLFALPQNAVYRQAGHAELPVNYSEFRREFNVMAAAILDFPLELIMPAGGSKTRGPSLQGAERFENDRIKELVAFFREITHAFLVRAYEKQWKQIMHGTDLHPMLDVEVIMPVTSAIPDETLFRMHKESWMSRHDMLRNLFRNHNLPEEQILDEREAMHEMLLKRKMEEVMHPPQQQQQPKKPKKNNNNSGNLLGSAL